MRNRGVVMGVSALLALMVAGLGEGGESGRVSINLIAPSGTFSVQPAAALASATAVVEDLSDGCRFLTLCLSNRVGLACTEGSPAEGDPEAFVLAVGIRLPEGSSVAAGKWTDLSVVMRAAAVRYRSHGNVGSITLTSTTGPITGRLEIENPQLKVVGEFSARLLEAGAKASSGERRE